jgi:hypothetical protein
MTEENTKMRKRLYLLLAGALALACPGLMAPGFAGKTVTDPITVTLGDVSGDSIQSDIKGRIYTDGQLGVSAWLGDQMNLRTDASNREPSNRKLWLDFDHGDIDANGPPPSGHYPAYLWNNGYDLTRTTTLRTMATNDVRYFALWVRFNTPDGTAWELGFNPAGSGNSPVKVTCLEALKKWRIETEPFQSMARLLKVSPGPYVDHGHFSMPFSLVFTTP